MQYPDFQESRHPLVQALQACTDEALVLGMQQSPQEGRYFVAIFCRYGTMAYILLRQTAPVSLQSDYLFARVWRNIFLELPYLQVTATGETDASTFSLQSWILNKVAACINQEALPPIESISYSFEAASPPLWCYLQRALDELPGIYRLVLVLSQIFHWQAERIVAFLQAEGESVTLEELPSRLAQAYKLLIEALPGDLQTIYWEAQPQLLRS
ncbi:sigma-70 family RNA polymerase sigma factor [Synechococcales cyanobacterium C]|uniref:Sigma-70 family RNA polymerase sigma factor n=2 Tax=Petrachloros TaxID=2918834 RepID=A0A8K2A0P0_9CYAN|nr:sigma-70 family RNA polymerase sigma factor [Petrachloros mirabilis ULC683]